MTRGSTERRIERLEQQHEAAPGDLGDLRAGVDRSKRFCRILQKRFTRGSLPMRLVLPRLRRDDRERYCPHSNEFVHVPLHRPPGSEFYERGRPRR